MGRENKIRWANKLIAAQQTLTSSLRPRAELAGGQDFGCIAIFSTTALGDLMFNTPAIRQLRLRYPKARLILFAHKKYRSLLEEYRDVDEVVYWDGQFRGVPRVVCHLRRRRAQLAVILHSREPYDVLSAALGGCAFILRDTYGDGRIGMEQWLAGYLPHYHGHVIQRKLDLLAPLGCSAAATAMLPPCLPKPERDGQGLRVGFQLGASKPDRCWPISHFADLAKSLLSSDENLEILLLGMPQEQILGQQLLAMLEPALHGRIRSMIGKTSVRRAFDVIAGLDLLVTGDTGPLHIAVALQVPTVSLFATAYPQATGPYQDHHLHRVIYRPPPSGGPEDAGMPMSKIAAEEVFACARTGLFGEHARRAEERC